MFGQRLPRWLGLVERTSQPLCYVLHSNNLIKESGNYPCGGSDGGTAFCCNGGDICTEASICHFTHPLSSVPGTSGYYVGGCTDPTFQDPVCSRQCTEFPTQDIVYNSTTDEWACCFTDADSTVDCTRPGNETFQAPPLLSLTQAPSYNPTSTPLRSTPSAASSSASAYTTSAALSSTSSPIRSNPQPVSNGSSPSTGLSTSAKAGIGIGAGIAGLLVLTAVLLIHLLRRRRKEMSVERIMSTGDVQPSTDKRFNPEAAFSAPPPPPPLAEFGAEQLPERLKEQMSELDTMSPISEIDDDYKTLPSVFTEDSSRRS